MQFDFEFGGSGREREGARGRERGETEFSEYIPVYFIYLHIPAYTFKYLQILYIPSYTLIYFKISQILNLRADMKHKNDHNSGPRAFPKVRI